MSAIIGTSQYIDYFNNPQGVVQGGIGSALAGGSVIGAIMAGPVSNKYGRRDSLFFACIWWLLGTALQTSCNGIGMLVAGRFINGICVGITSSQAPVYLAEIAKKESRGSIIVIQQWSIEWGIFIMYFVGYGCSFIKSTPTASFRTAWAMQFVPCVILMMGIPFLPRSPRWLAKVGREKEAIAILADIQAGGNINDPLVIAEWEEITTILAAEREGQKGWRRFFKNGMWKRTLAGTSVQAWQQLSGANVMTYYVVYIFEMASLTGNIGLVSSGIQYAIFIIGTAATFFFIDKTGRRPLLVSACFPNHQTQPLKIDKTSSNPNSPDLRRPRNGHLHVRRRRHPRLLRHLPPRRTRRQSQRPRASLRLSSLHRHHLLLPSRAALLHNSRAHRLGLRR